MLTVGLMVLPAVVSRAPGADCLLQVEDFRGPWRDRTDVAGYLGRGFRSALSSEVASTAMTGTARIERAGDYWVWLRAYAGPDADPKKAARALQVSVNGRKLARTHERASAGWSWELAGRVRLQAGRAEVAVHDADTGYEGADAVLLTDRGGEAGDVPRLYDLLLYVRQAAADGSLLLSCRGDRRIENDSAGQWHAADSPAEITDAGLLEALERLRWLRNRSVRPVGAEGPAGGFVELHNGDRLPGLAVGGTAARSDAWAHTPACLLVQPSVPVGPPDEAQPEPFGVLAEQVRRVVLAGVKPREHLSPGTAFCRDGRRIAFVAARWVPGGVRLLTQDAIHSLALEELAEVHLPAADPWRSYYDELAGLDPAGGAGLIRLEAKGGLTVTTSTRRCSIAGGGRRARGPMAWCYVVQPAWSRRALWVPAAAIAERRQFAPHEVPLSRLRPERVVQHSLLGNNWWPWRLDRGVLGGRLHSGGAEYAWGFGVHATNELIFRLPACARAFRAKVGLDRAAGAGGCAVAKVLTGPGEPRELYRSERLVGSGRVADVGEVRLAAPEAAPHELVLVADAAHEGRPPAADPFDIRDHVDWLEPMLLLDPAALRREVAGRVGTDAPTWRGWQVRIGGGGPVPLATRWDPSELPGPRFVLDVAPEGRTIVAATEQRISDDTQWLYVKLSAVGAAGPAGQVEVRVNGKPAARFEVPPSDFFRPVVVPLVPWKGRKAAVEVALKPGAARERFRWDALALVPRTTAVNWVPLKVARASVLGSARLTALPDGSLLASGDSDDAETFLIACRTDLPRIAGIRLEALTHPSLPCGGPGRNGNGKFHLARVRVTTPITRRKPIRGRYVRIELPGADRTLRLSEVEVFAPPTAAGDPPRKLTGRARQSSTEGKFAAAMAVNGVRVTKHGSADYASTGKQDDPWWELDLGAERAIERIVVWNRAYYYTNDELAHFNVEVLDGKRKAVLRRTDLPDPLPAVEISDSDERQVALASAAATAYQQWGDYRPERSLDATTQGWAPGQPGQPHAAVYTLEAPVDARETGLVVHLSHCRGKVWQTAGSLGRFRLLATDQPPPLAVEQVPMRVPLLSAADGKRP